MKLFVLTLLVLFTPTTIKADRYHYKNKIIGSRAVGLGGAYGGISDDPSGLFYNPAGLGYTDINAISANASTTSKKTIEYKNILNSKDAKDTKSFNEISTTSSPTYFGGTQGLGRFKLAFAIVIPDSEVIDQKDEMTIYLGKWMRSYLATNELKMSGGGFGYAFNDSLSVGFSLFYYQRNIRAITVQNRIQGWKDKDGNTFFNFDQPIQRDVHVHTGILPKFGLQYWPLPRLSLSLAVDQGISLNNENKRTFSFAKGQIKTNANDANKKIDNFAYDFGDTDFKLGEHMPFHTLIASTWFVSSRLLLGFDFDYYGATKEGTKFNRDFNATAVINFSLGMEYYVLPFIPVSFGAFTNNANTPELKTTLDKNAPTQPEHIDLIGATLGLGWEQNNSAVNFAVVVQQGSGNAEKNPATIKNTDGLTKTVKIQGTDIFAYEFTISGSYAF